MSHPLRFFARFKVRSVSIALIVGSGAFGGPASDAQAQTNPGALAEALFRSARALVAAGDFPEACPKFAESQRIDPKLGTLMNLALCHEKIGKTASAWAEYTQAAELASRAGQLERERVARAGAEALEAMLPHLVLRPSSGDAMMVTLDGQTIGGPSLGTSIPVDPGVHEVVATAVGRTSFSRAVTIPAGPGEQVVVLPVLEPGLNAPPVVLPLPTSDGLIAASSGPHHPHDAAARRRIAAYALLGGAGFALVTGAVFGGLAFSKKSSAQQQCGATSCTPQGLDDISFMKASEAVSTIAFGAGIVAASAGLYFVLRGGARSDQSVSAVSPPPPVLIHVDPIIGERLAGAQLTGRF